MLGTESGSNVFDFTKTVSSAIQKYEKLHPNADFMTVYELFLKKIDGKIRMNQISPRLFESIAYGTVAILFEGEYSGVVSPWKHYLPLKKDFSNIDEILAASKDIPLLEKIARQSYADIIQAGKYGFDSLVARIDEYIIAKICDGAKKHSAR